jgi:CelD/BcsL family acetyltransferase involved in cellulose biosynthesis
LVAVAPMMLTHRPGRLPVGVRQLEFFGADLNITELRGVICRPEDHKQALDTIARHALAIRAQWDWLGWQGVLQPDDAACWPGEGGRFIETKPIPNYFLELPESWEAFRASLSRNIRESLRKCYNSLKRDGHEFSFRVVSAPDQVAAAIDQFLALHGARARAADAVFHRDVFADPRARRLLHDYVASLAASDQARIFQLHIGGAVVASRIGFRFDDELYLYYSGFDPDWGRYSVMTTVVAEAIHWAIEHDMRIVNLSTGKDVSKTRWGPREIVYHGAIQVAPTLRGRLAFGIYQRLRGALQSGSLAGRALAVLRRGAVEDDAAG